MYQGLMNLHLLNMEQEMTPQSIQSQMCSLAELQPIEISLNFVAAYSLPWQYIAGDVLPPKF